MSELQKIKKVLSGLVDGIASSRSMNKAGLAAIRLIKQRTREGVDLDGSAFQEYSEGYKKRKARAGLPTSPVNLTFNDVDGMMNTMDHVVAADLQSVEVLFSDADKATLAGYHHETGAGRSRVIRRFFDLSDDERLEIGELFEEDINLLLQELTKD